MPTLIIQIIQELKRSILHFPACIGDENFNIFLISSVFLESSILVKVLVINSIIYTFSPSTPSNSIFNLQQNALSPTR